MADRKEQLVLTKARNVGEGYFNLNRCASECEGFRKVKALEKRKRGRNGDKHVKFYDKITK